MQQVANVLVAVVVGVNDGKEEEQRRCVDRRRDTRTAQCILERKRRSFARSQVPPLSFMLPALHVYHYNPRHNGMRACYLLRIGADGDALHTTEIENPPSQPARRREYQTDIEDSTLLYSTLPADVRVRKAKL